ncbi:protease sohb, putative, partial [Ichthyophthirius multifiliis]
MFLNQTYQVIQENNIKVISARSRYENYFPNECYQWKIEAFKDLQKFHDKQIVTNLVCLGDSHIEMQAAQQLGKQFQQILVKTVKFKEYPRIDELIKQLQLVKDNFEYVFYEFKNLTIKLEKAPLYTFAEDYALGNGYLLLSLGEKVYGNPLSLIGSIHTRIQYFSFEKLLEKYGIKFEVYSKTKHSFLPLTKPTKEDLEFAQARNEELLKEVQKRIVQNRRRQFESKGFNEEQAISQLLNGQTFTSQQALQNGYYLYLLFIILYLQKDQLMKLELFINLSIQIIQDIKQNAKNKQLIVQIKLIIVKNLDLKLLLIFQVILKNQKNIIQMSKIFMNFQIRNYNQLNLYFNQKIIWLSNIL